MPIRPLTTLAVLCGAAKEPVTGSMAELAPREKGIKTGNMPAADVAETMFDKVKASKAAESIFLAMRTLGRKEEVSWPI